ncbi:MAG: transcriptional regulator [Burkholderiaceae bacterium]|nr:transcriptional regulator [Burkholderiaceae bacterium]
MPKMGTQPTRTTETRSTSLAGALFSVTQQRVLGLLFGQPDRSFYATELINLAGVGSGAVQRELARLAQSGLVTVKPVGNQKHYQANPGSPVYEELCGMVRKTVGMAEPLRAALAPLAAQIKVAFVYGSIAKQQDTARSDIDLLLVSDTLTYGDTILALQNVSAQLGREVNPNIFTPQDFAKRLREGGSFVSRVMAQPKVWLIGGPDDLAL